MASVGVTFAQIFTVFETSYFSMKAKQQRSFGQVEVAMFPTCIYVRFWQMKSQMNDYDDTYFPF